MAAARQQLDIIIMTQDRNVNGMPVLSMFSANQCCGRKKGERIIFLVCPAMRHLYFCLYLYPLNSTSRVFVRCDLHTKDTPRET